MRLTFSAEDHVYRVDGSPVRSVTRIIEQAGMGTDYSTVDPSILEKAKWRGTHVDHAVNLLDENDLDWDTVHPTWRGYVEAYAKWKEEEHPAATLSQIMVYHPELHYAGTLDKLYLYKLGGAVIADVKTSKSLHRNPYGLQIAAYAMPGLLYVEYPGQACDVLVPLREITGRWLLHLTPKVCTKVVCTDADDFQDFIACLHAAENPNDEQAKRILAQRRDRYANGG